MMADGDNPDLCAGAVLLRIDPTLERDRLIYQIGTGEAGLAMQAVERVVQDVAGVDVNMGCPKKFSVSGGMGRCVSCLNVCVFCVDSYRRCLTQSGLLHRLGMLSDSSSNASVSLCCRVIR